MVYSLLRIQQAKHNNIYIPWVHAKCYWNGGMQLEMSDYIKIDATIHHDQFSKQWISILKVSPTLENDPTSNCKSKSVQNRIVKAPVHQKQHRHTGKSGRHTNHNHSTERTTVDDIDTLRANKTNHSA